MPLNLRGAGDHPEIGIKVDSHGIAYDATTGQSLSREEVDSRIATFQQSNPGTEVYGLEKKRGGLAGIYDANKKIINPVVEGALGLIPGVGIPLAAGYGAAVGGLDQEGQGGISFDAGDALQGGVKGAAIGGVGSLVGKGIGALTGAKPATGGVSFGDTANAAISGTSGGGSTLDKIKGLLGGGTAGAAGGGLQLADILKALGGGVTAGLDYKNNQANIDEKKAEFARTTGNTEAQTAVNAQQLLNRAPMADNAQALLRARMATAPTTFAPRDYTRTGANAATMQAPAVGGAQDQLAAARTAAAGYTPGAGGVDTSALELLKKKMYASSGMSA